MEPAAPWPVLREYDQEHLARIALPLGGIGTGTVSLGGRGNLTDWEIVNRTAKGFVPGHPRLATQRLGPFFALQAQAAGSPPVARALEGPLPAEDYEGGSGAVARNHGLPRFRACRFRAAYPLGQVLLTDPALPLEVRIEAYNPLIPGDAESSGLPLAVLRFVLHNPTAQDVAASVCGSLPNFIGTDGAAGRARGNRNAFRVQAAPALAGLLLSSDGVPADAEQWGTIALAAVGPPEGGQVTYRTNWATDLTWGKTLLDFWDDFSADGRLEDRRPSAPDDTPIASLAVRAGVPPGESRALTFLLCWHFPNRQTWTPSPEGPNRVGNHYATRFRDAWDVAEQVAPDLAGLEARTVAFVRAFCESDLPAAIREAALFNLSSLRSQTVFRTEDGRLFGWEGGNCCHGSCTHVWNYEQATAFLFGDLALGMREVEFAHATAPNGLMSFRVHLPLARAQEWGRAAADGQMGCVMKLYRDWQLSGDLDRLRALWPAARRALAFAWVPGGWDADRDGVMEGVQHNTMDVEYLGPNPQMGLWYLGALRAAEEMARHLGDLAFADACRDLFRRGGAWIDAHLWTGEYYEQEVRPVADAAAVAPGLRAGMGPEDLAHPDVQLGAGCLVDQLVGQYMAHVCGLGYLVDEEHVRGALEAIFRHNFRATFAGHFVDMRSYALGEEAGLVMASYPRGPRPRFPFPYFNEAMTGFEYTAAVHMLYEGQEDAGLRCIEAIRGRYDGRKRNPFDEAECGHHYARAMASWAAVLAWTGFGFSAVTGEMRLRPRPGRHFWSTGRAFGTCALVPGMGAFDVDLRVLGGRLSLRRFLLDGVGDRRWADPEVLEEGGRAAFRVVAGGRPSDAGALR